MKCLDRICGLSLHVVMLNSNPRAEPCAAEMWTYPLALSPFSPERPLEICVLIIFRFVIKSREMLRTNWIQAKRGPGVLLHVSLQVRS
jgi:hypothetical protein